MKDKYELMRLIWRCLFYHDTHGCVVSPNDKKSKDAYKSAVKLLPNKFVDIKPNKIEFTNGSVIEFVVPLEETENIRGKRSKIKEFWVEDLPLYNDEFWDEIFRDVIENK